MSAVEYRCIEIRCDGPTAVQRSCNAELAMEEDSSAIHWADRAEAATFAARHLSAWEVSADGSTPDLCPDCVCHRGGHRRGGLVEPEDREALRCCVRCGVPRRVSQSDPAESVDAGGRDR